MTEATLSRTSIRMLLELAKQQFCSRCNARGLILGPRDYLGDHIAQDCPDCSGKGFVPKGDSQS